MSEISIKRVCCTCLSTDRKLYQLCRVLDGINLLYMLLTHDPEAYKDGFYKDSASLFVCWECRATMHRIKRFQAQACVAQKHLSSIADGRNDAKLQSFSRLSCSHYETPHYEFQSNDVTTENFIDCGPEIKTESDSDDIPLSVFYHENYNEDYDVPGSYNIEPGNIAFEPGSDSEHDSKPGVNAIKAGNDSITPGNNAIRPGKAAKPGNINIAIGSPTPRKDIVLINKSSNPDFNTSQLKPDITNDPVKIVSKKKTKMKYSKYFSLSTMDEEEMLKSLEKRKMDINEAVYKCGMCILEFKTENEVITHHTDYHEKKGNHIQCDICLSYTEELLTHRQTHYQCYRCVLCTYAVQTRIDIVRHLKRNHKEICNGKKKGSKRKQNGLCLKEISKYPCPECVLTFQNKDMRWKHIQKAHREGHKCNTCDKKFAFRNNLERHERIHQGPLPREECPTCHKMIRTDLVKVHSRTHADRQRHTCVECDKNFVSRATYESHLKYARAHATADVCRHKCPSCHKRYRSRGELQDHVNYHHKGQAEHKCPICGKGLATKRCIRRHVRRAHEGIKESAKDKICQQCGKAFRDKKGLIEHERVHTGARPLACAACGRAFRQRAALYAHSKRVHRHT